MTKRTCGELILLFFEAGSFVCWLVVGGFFMLFFFFTLALSSSPISQLPTITLKVVTFTLLVPGDAKQIPNLNTNLPRWSKGPRADAGL